MANTHIELTPDIIDRVRQLSEHVEQGNQDETHRLIEEITRLRENNLYQELGKLTREFHNTLNSFRLDARIADFTEKDFPDARDRLRHVVKMTAESADKSLTATESAMPICDRLHTQAEDLQGQWERFTRREMSAEEFRHLSTQLGTFFTSLQGDTESLRGNLNEIVMAQDFQDLTGQIIGRVITLVDDMESSLVELVRLSGQNMAAHAKPVEEDALKPSGPPVPGVDKGEVVSGQDAVDDLLSSLGF